METRSLPMEIREVSEPQRLITGMVAPYDETSLLTGDPWGERILRHAFARSIAQRGKLIPLCVDHDHKSPIGMSREWEDGDSGLVGTFYVRENANGDQALADAREGYLAGMSVGFLPVERKAARDGVMEVREARLVEVSLCLLGAYESAQVLAARVAKQAEDLLKPFQNPPALPVAFIPPWG